MRSVARFLSARASDLPQHSLRPSPTRVYVVAPWSFLLGHHHRTKKTAGPLVLVLMQLGWTQTALRLAPESARLYLSCGLVLSQLGRKEAALKLLGTALALAPASLAPGLSICPYFFICFCHIFHIV